MAFAIIAATLIVTIVLGVLFSAGGLWLEWKYPRKPNDYDHLPPM